MFLDTTLVLPTSGTTGVPKLVPLTQANINASIQAWVSVLGLTSSDRCLNMMPLWHGSFIANVLSSASVGAITVNVPKPSPLELWQLIAEYKPTWLPLPSDLAKQILGEETISASVDVLRCLRFVRLSKASLSVNEIHELGRIFHCPVLQSYGITEAASGPVACESVDHRRPGSVGRPIHLEVKIGERLDEGHIFIRGPSVMAGYIAGPQDSHIFVNYDNGGKWFRTGDLGYVDPDGFLYITGRA